MNVTAVIIAHLCHCPGLSIYAHMERPRTAASYTFITSTVTDTLQPKHTPPAPSLIPPPPPPHLTAQMYIPSHWLDFLLLPHACSASYMSSRQLSSAL